MPAKSQRIVYHYRNINAIVTFDDLGRIIKAKTEVGVEKNIAS